MGRLFDCSKNTEIIHTVVYGDEEVVVECSQACVAAGRCQCTKCRSEYHFLFSLITNTELSGVVAKCIGCPAGNQLDADEAVANVLGLATGPNYKSELGTIMQG
jgi:hypothetical protein